MPPLLLQERKIMNAIFTKGRFNRLEIIGWGECAFHPQYYTVIYRLANGALLFETFNWKGVQVSHD